MLEMGSENMNMTERSLVTIIDDDPSVLESLPVLVETLGHGARAFASAEAFLVSDCVGSTRCLILDISMPGMSGPELQEELHTRGQDLPTIFITGQENDALFRRMLAKGAVACLLKPFTDTEIEEALNVALHAA